MEERFSAIQGLSVFALLFNFVGNSIVIAVLHKVKSMNTNTNYMLGSLAVNDLIFGAVAFAEIALHYLYLGNKLRDGTVGITAKQFSFKVLLRAFISVFTLAAIAVERYYAILKPFVHRARMSKKLMRRVAFCIWIAAVIFYLPGNIAQRFSEAKDFCNIYIVVFLLTCILVPGVVMISCYSKIVYRIWFKTQERVQTNAGVLKSRKKLTKLLVTITLVFFICWTPLLGRIFEFQSAQSASFYNMFSGLLALVGTAINPVLYSLRSLRFRQAVRELFNGLRCRRKSRYIRDIEQPKAQSQTTPL